MPIGQHLTTCLACLKQFICGDCIESECPECQCKRRGHLPVGGICGRCGVRLEHQWKRQRIGGSPSDAESDEVVEYCDRCGVENPGSNPNIELPACDFTPPDVDELNQYEGPND